MTDPKIGQMIGAKVVVSTSIRSVWNSLMHPANWKLWWADLREVTPAWQTGASMKWAIGLPSKINAFKEEEVLSIGGDYLLTTIGLRALGPGTTEVEIIEVPLGGANFPDGGAARRAQLDRVLGDLKRVMESGQADVAVPAPQPTPVPWPGSAPAVPVPQAAAPLRYAHAGMRFLAYLIDFAVLFIPTMIVMSMIIPASRSSRDSAWPGMLSLLLIAGWWLYFAVMESSPNGATVGKMLLHMKVADMAGDRISFARASGRFFAKILGVLTFYVGFLMAFFTAKRQALHDMAAGCVVISTHEEGFKIIEPPRR